MKLRVIAVIFGGLFCGLAKAECHSEIICTPLGGCGEQTVCTADDPNPVPPPENCERVYICSDGITSCYWDLVCH